MPPERADNASEWHGENGRGRSSRAVDALRIGCNQPLPPLIEERDGEPAGFEPDLARLLCSRLGWWPQGSYRRFSDLPNLLDAGELACIMWNFVRTPERAERFALRAERFALSLACGGTDMALLVRAESPLAGTHDLAGRIVGAVRFTTNLEQARRLAGAPEVRVYDPGMKVLGSSSRTRSAA
jgi:ABC-type amino acid transport substrate-binding protein